MNIDLSNNNFMDHLVSLKDAAIQLKRTTQSVIRLAKIGKLEGIQIPRNKLGRWYIKQESINAFKENEENKTHKA